MQSMTPIVSLSIFSKHNMEYQFPTFSVILCFLLFMLMILKIASEKRSKATNSTPDLPPRPWRLPVIGNLHHLIGSLPHHRLRDLANKYGPLMNLQLGELAHIIISSPEAAQEMMKTHDVNFAQRPFLLAESFYDDLNIGFAPYGEYWRQLRKICSQELLSPKRVKSFGLIREEEVSNLIRCLYSNPGATINISEKIFSLTCGITAKAAFGKKCKDQEAFISSVKEGTKTAGGFSASDAFPSQKWLRWITGMGPKLEKCFLNTDRILENIIKECEAEMAAMTGEVKAKSLLAVLLNLQYGGDHDLALETRNLKAIIMDIFIGGSETSATVVEWAMSEMLRTPRVMEKAQAEVTKVFGRKGNVDEEGLRELKFLKLIIKETLRLHPPAPLLVPRESRESCVLHGYNIPAKTRVIVNAWAIGRDPRYWYDSEKFYPERFIDSTIDFKGNNFELIPFGAGRRICPGISFGIASIELPLAQLLFHFDWKLPHGTNHENLDMTESFGLTVRRKEDLFLIAVPCYSAPTLF